MAAALSARKIGTRAALSAFMSRKGVITMQEWTADSLFARATYFIECANAIDKLPDLKSLLYVLSLEPLGKSALAAKHPSLVADPESPIHLYYALGLATPPNPRSIVAKTVFLRCKDLIDDFTDEIMKLANKLTQYRNQELHSGGDPFANAPLSTWINEYYRIAKPLLASLAKDFSDLLGEEEGELAITILKELDTDRANDAKKKLAAARKKAARLTKEQREQTSPADVTIYRAGGTTHKCPACGENAILYRDKIRESNVRAEDNEIRGLTLYRPKSLKCQVCGLQLEGPIQLKEAGIDTPITEEWICDPAEYYNLVSADDYDDEYMNE